MFHTLLTIAVSHMLRGVVGVAPQHLIVVVSHLLARIWQAHIAHLDCVSVYKWEALVPFWEMLVKKGEDLFPFICLDIQAVKGNKPNSYFIPCS